LAVLSAFVSAAFKSAVVGSINKPFEFPRPQRVNALRKFLASSAGNVDRASYLSLEDDHHYRSCCCGVSDSGPISPRVISASARAPFRAGTVVLDLASVCRLVRQPYHRAVVSGA